MRHRPSDSLPTLYKPLPVTQSSAWVIHGAPELVVGVGKLASAIRALLYPEFCNSQYALLGVVYFMLP